MASADPHSYSDLGQGTISHVALRLEPDFAARRVCVQAEYTLDRPIRGSLFLDAKGLAIGGVKAEGAPVRWELDRDDPILGQRLHLRDLRDIRRFSIEAISPPGAAALQWLEPAQTAGGSHVFLYSQCQACSARTLFPCQDTPGVRFTYDAELTAPSPLAAVMAAERLGEERRGAATIFRYRMPQPIPSYLFAFAVGNLVFEPIGPRTGIWAEPETIAAAAWEFAENEEKIRVAEAIFGAYLWDRYDLLLMPPAFPYGGMENPRLTFLNACYVLGDRSGTFMVSHELAHAWTGNLVTNASWEDFWLNEGPTTYAETRITEALEGIDTADLRTAGRALRLQRAIDRLGADSPMTRLRLPLQGKDPDESYSDVPYYKGLLFFRALERAAGRPAFDRFLHAYIDTFRFRSIDSERFVEFLETTLPDVTGTVDARRWIYQAGLPEGAAQVHSVLLDDVEAVAADYRQGIRPSPERIAGWTLIQRSVFLGLLLPAIPASDCAYYESLFGLPAARDGELRSRFFELAVRSGYRAAFPAYEAFFASIGRYNFHEPVFRALAAEAWSRPLARPLLERWRHRHHAHTVAAIERILVEAGL